MAQALGPDKCRGLPAFHAFTGCDTVSINGGRNKQKYGIGDVEGM